VHPPYLIAIRNFGGDINVLSQVIHLHSYRHNPQPSTNSLVTMGRELQKKKRRSGRQPIRQSNRTKKILNPRGNDAIAKNWCAFQPPSIQLQSANIGLAGTRMRLWHKTTAVLAS
jgi:hypothetical protein